MYVTYSSTYSFPPSSLFPAEELFAIFSRLCGKLLREEQKQQLHPPPTSLGAIWQDFATKTLL
jgi:hypothetical protein